MTEPDPEDVSKWKRPLTEEQLLRIRPHLESMALRLSNCASTRDDYIQSAYLRLIDTDRKWRNPLVAAYSAMADERRRNSKWSALKSMGDLEPDYVMSDLLQFSELKDLKWLDVDDDHRRVAVLHWVEGLTQEAIAEAVGVDGRTIRQWLTVVMERLREQWFEPEEQEVAE